MRQHLLRSFCGSLIAVLGVGLWALSPGLATAADHRDGPRMINNASTLGSLDLNDLYIFASPTTPTNTVMILTSGGAGVGILSPPFYLPGAVFEFRISNDGNPLTDELVMQFVFSNPDALMRQSYTITTHNLVHGTVQTMRVGSTGLNFPLSNGGTVRAGLFDDPFFFDSLAFQKFRSNIQAGMKPPAAFAPFLPPSIPNDFFGDFNTLAIVLEVPRTVLQSSAINPNITVWTRSLLPPPDGSQFDRTGLPAINTAVNFAQPLQNPPLPDLQDAFNSLEPMNDPGLRMGSAQRIVLAYGATPAEANALVGIVLPDVMPYNSTNKGGFLNGRKLTDDVIDAELGLLSGGVLTSDRVINDSIFSARFPYLGAPLPINTPTGGGGSPPTTGPGKGPATGPGKGPVTGPGKGK